jgi:hypothetical protein
VIGWVDEQQIYIILNYWKRYNENCLSGREPGVDILYCLASDYISPLLEYDMFYLQVLGS